MHILIPVLRAGGEAIPLGKNTALVRGYKMSRPDWGFCYARTRNLIVRNSAAGGVYRNCFLGKLPETPPFTDKVPCHPERRKERSDVRSRRNSLFAATSSTNALSPKNSFVKGFFMVVFCSMRGDPSTSLHSSLCSLFSYAQDDRHRSN